MFCKYIRRGEVFRQKLVQGNAVSLQLIGVGRRHCRLLYILTVQPELI